MDSTTVNYAIEKLNEAFTKIAPTAVNLGEEFIAYTVFKAVISAIILPLLAITLGYIAFLLASKALEIVKENGERYRADQEAIPGVGAALTGAVAIVAAALSVGAIYDGILAVAYPLMYTIESLVK